MSQSRRNAAIYARSATLPQSREADTLAEQVRECRSYCEKQRWCVEDRHIYQEVASGATGINRPEVARLLHAAKQGAFDAVVVFAYDRLSRIHAHSASLVAALENWGVHVVSVSEPQGNTEIETILSHMLTQLHKEVEKMEREER